MSRLLIPLSFTPKSGGPEGSWTPVSNTLSLICLQLIRLFYIYFYGPPTNLKKYQVGFNAAYYG